MGIAGAEYGVALHDPAVRRALVAEASARPAGRRVDWPTAGRRCLRLAATALWRLAGPPAPDARPTLVERAGGRA